MKDQGFIHKIFWALIGVGVALAYCFLFMMLWNWLIPCLFKGPYLNYIHAAGLLLLGKMFFGNLGIGGCRDNSCRGTSKWKTKFFDKWSCVPEDEKEKWKSKLKDCFEEKNKKDGDSQP